MRVVELHEVLLRMNGTQVLEDISIEIPAGDFVALIGQNGAGKTTLIKVILGTLRPHRGAVKVFEEDVAEFRDWHRIGYIPQHATNFDPEFPASVWEIASLGRVPRRGLLRFLSKEDREAIDSALETVGMTPKRRKRIGELSGGEKQRVLIARALASEPDFLILDEPTAGVDPGMQEEVYEFLKMLNETKGITILLATHDLGAVLRIAKTVACINRRLVCHRSMAEGLTAEELIETYGSSLAAVTHTH
ncbi:MAG: metal ABC transporter ATP-binding protein [Thermoplasmata archaeon]